MVKKNNISLPILYFSSSWSIYGYIILFCIIELFFRDYMIIILISNTYNIFLIPSHKLRHLIFLKTLWSSTIFIP